MYSASMVESAVSDRNLLPHETGIFPRVMTKPDLDLTDFGSSGSEVEKRPAKSASAKQSRVRSFVGRMIMPFLRVPRRFRPIRLSVTPCGVRGSIEKRAH